MKMNVYVALLGSATALKLKQTGDGSTWTPPATLKETCFTGYPATWSPPSSLTCP